MTTKIYGASDDLVEFEGEVSGETNCFRTDEHERGVLVVCSDGTILEVKYGKCGAAIWGVTVLKKGELLDRIDACDDEDADPCSDVAHFRNGLKWAYAATEWERVK